MPKERQGNDPPPTADEIKEMRLLKLGELIKNGDWIGDINEWSDSDENGPVGDEFIYVWRSRG